MSQDSAKSDESQTSATHACIPETSSCPIDIRPHQSSTKVQPWSGQTSAFGSAPPKRFSASRSSTFSSPSNLSISVGKSFTTWDDPTRCAFISDTDLCSSDEDGLENAPLEPKPQLPVMPLLKIEKGDLSRQAHRIKQRRVAKKTLPKIKESSEEK
ncbi:hypothetical protein K432DRAFT_394765 [Lepidopterella palustris CBS 459.81]|uniref:Uncharacterized protein n=1 Tax=Lepidopterella palustris CBS 459.81 TaxID=1314670 RepID=A0A8E2E6Z4_9PEZI|nr:hypothetical protein K432DRAFT_394765 [Lepidopterella palustris CBS 459.81]